MKLLDHTERACELVYEALTGECWHKYNRSWDGDQWFISPNELCSKCGTRYYVWKGKNPTVLDRRNHNPDLVNSLDAWRLLWERMEYRNYIEKLMDILGGEFIYHDTSFARYNVVLVWSQFFALATAQPIHHLEAALRAIEVECPLCKGTKKVTCADICGLDDNEKCGGSAGDCPEFECSLPEFPTDCTCNNGKITLYEKLEGEVEKDDA